MNFRNPENPYVKNPNFYVDAQPYYQSPSYYVHITSNTSAFAIGISLTFLQTFLILFKTPHQFRPYSKMLLLCVITDVVVLLIDFWCQVRVIVKYKIILMHFTGLASYLPYRFQCLSIGPQTFGTGIPAALLPFQYYYRYFTLKNHRTPTLFQTLCNFSLSIAFSLVFVVCTIKSYCSNPDDLTNLTYEHMWFKERPIPQLVVGLMESPWMVGILIYLSIFLFTCYALAMFFAHQTIKELHKQEHQLSNRTKHLQRQFSRALFVQAISPLLASILLLLLGVLAFFTDLSILYVGEAIMIGQTWLPVLNCVSNLIFLVPYKNYCLKLLRCHKKRITVSSVQPSSTAKDLSRIATVM